MKRLCIQWPRFGPYHVARLGATGRFLREHGVDVVGLETASSDGTYSWESIDTADDFERITAFPGKRYDSIHPRPMEAAIEKHLDQVDPDVVAINSYSLPDARASLSWCRRRGRRSIILIDSQRSDAGRVWWRERVKSAILSQFDAALVGGSPHFDYLTELDFEPARIRTGCDVVDNDFFSRISREVNNPPEARRRFIAVNRFVPRKNMDLLVAAYSLYRNQVSNPWELVLVGDGPGRQSLVDRVATDGVGGIEFLGNLSQTELASTYATCGVLVHPALRDQWGLVVNEAMASGLPVLVSTGAGCATDLVHEGVNGYTFAPTNREQLADLLVRMSDDSTDLESMGIHSREIIADWSPESFAAKLYETAIIATDGVPRPSSAFSRALLWTLRYSATHTAAFHSVEA